MARPNANGVRRDDAEVRRQAIKKAVEMSWKPVHVNGQRWELFGPVITDEPKS